LSAAPIIFELNRARITFHVAVFEIYWTMKSRPQMPTKLKENDVFTAMVLCF